MSQDKKYQVFISSTYTDLIEARNAAINIVLESYNFPVGMEMFGADNDEQWTIIKDLIDSSDFYILIMGQRYGSISKKDGISFTEKEFDYALEKGVKLMCFVRKDNVATLPHERDEDPEIKEKIALFRTKVTTDRTCEFWESVDDLKHKISNSLYKNMRKHGGTGWVRGNQVSGQLAEEIAKLSEDNRKLREENELLKSKFEIRKPELKVYLNKIHSGEDRIVINFPILPDSMKFKLPEKRVKTILSDNLIHLEDTFTALSRAMGKRRPEEYFDSYNNEIDQITEIKIDAHDLNMQLLRQLKVGLLKLEIGVENIGTAIANNVSLEIEVPDFLEVIDDNAKLDIKHYEKEFSINLIKIDTPEERSEQSMNQRLFEVSPISRNINFPTTVEKNVKDYVDKNIIHFNAKSILHSKSEILRNFHLFPIEHGNGVLKIKVICAEYAHPEVFEIPITVQ